MRKIKKVNIEVFLKRKQFHHCIVIARVSHLIILDYIDLNIKREWCRDNFGTPAIISDYPIRYETCHVDHNRVWASIRNKFFFKNEADAVLFKLML